MRRLYFRIYLAVLGSLALFALLVALSGFLFHEIREPEDSATPVPFLSDVAVHLLPADASPAALAQELHFWHSHTDFDLALLSPQGKVIARAGTVPDDAIAAAAKLGFHGFHHYGSRSTFTVKLTDGRQLIAVRPPHRFGPLFPMQWLGLVLAIGLAVAVAAYPLVRRLTRNLEELQRGVAALGRGDLSMRVAVRGRDEVGKLAETFNASANRIEALVDAQKMLLANTSHEIRSPLARLRMAAEAIGAAAPKEQRDEIARNIAELDGLVEDILLASRLGAETGFASAPQRIDLAGLLAEECAPYTAELSAGPGGPVYVEGDRRLLHRLFRNLLENARRHGGDGAIEVSVTCASGQAIVLVCDEGPGIRESERARVFDPYYRAKRQAEGGGGTGLGLSLVRQIAEKHHGDVRYVPRDGTAGACFKVTLPLCGAPL